MWNCQQKINAHSWWPRMVWVHYVWWSWMSMVIWWTTTWNWQCPECMILSPGPGQFPSGQSSPFLNCICFLVPLFSTSSLNGHSLEGIRILVVILEDVYIGYIYSLGRIATQLLDYHWYIIIIFKWFIIKKRDSLPDVKMNEIYIKSSNII